MHQVIRQHHTLIHDQLHDDFSMISLANTIINQDISTTQQLLRHGYDPNEIDEYGFRPLIEAAIVDSMPISQLLLQAGADPNLPDANGGTALHWAVENNNLDLVQLLLRHRANPNAYNFSGQPVLAMPMLRRQKEMQKLLLKAGARQIFAKDYINTKLLGHLFELVGRAHIISPDYQFVEVNFEGFFLEATLNLVADALSEFHNHFAARQLRHYAGLADYIAQILWRAGELIRYQQYRVDRKKHQQRIISLIEQQPTLIPVGYEGHAITFIRLGNIWVKCDRREDSRLYDNVMFYRVRNTDRLTTDLLQQLIYKKQDHDFINVKLDNLLGLEPLTELKVEAQVSGNCSWANVEACIPALFFLILMQEARGDDKITGRYKSIALDYFHRWREWNKDRSLNFCIQRYQEGGRMHKATNAEILAAILFQRCDRYKANERTRMEKILEILLKSPYEYILRNYLRVYHYENPSPEGKIFAEVLREYGFLK